MPTQGPLFPGTMASVEEVAAGDDNTWENPGNVAADDGAVATITAASFDTGDHSWALRCSNFGFTIPAGATIDGITVEFERRAASGLNTVADHQIQLFSAPGTLIGANKSAAAAWTGPMAVASYGGAADIWAAGLTPAIVNDPGFGVQIKALATGNNAIPEIDFVRMTLYWTEGGDVTAPVLSAQTVDSITSDGGTPKVTTDEGNGAAYMVVVPNGDVPSTAQIKAGQQSSGAAALAASNQAVSGTGVQTFAAVTGLTAETAYDVWFVHTDAALNNSTAAKADFTTLTAIVERTWVCQMMALTVVERQWTSFMVNEGPPPPAAGSTLQEIAARRRRRPHWKGGT